MEQTQGSPVNIIKKYLPYLSLALIAFVYMLPRIQSAQFGLLDDGVTLIVGQKFISDPLTPFKFMQFSGRFFPIFWIYQSFIFQFAQFAPYRWFIANAVLLYALSVILYKVAFTLIKNSWAAWLAGVFFIFSGPVVESFYTITKSEPIMLFFTGLAVMVFLSWEYQICLRKKIMVMATVAIFFFFAFASKETSIVMVGICGGWLGLAVIFDHQRTPKKNVRSFFWLFLASLIALGIYFALRQAFQTKSLSEGGYTSSYLLEFTIIRDQLLRWLGRFLRDYFFIFPLGLVLCIPKIRHKVNLRIVAFVVVWLAGWFVILLPWRVLESYYTLPFAFGLSLLSGLIAGPLFSTLPEFTDKLQRLFIWICVGATLVSLMILAINNSSNARLQLSFDHVNSRMVEELSHLPENATILFNVPEPLEYVIETRMHLQVLYDRADIKVEYLKYQPQFLTENQTTYIVSPVFTNQILPSVRNSIYSAGAIAWGNCLDAFLIGQPNAELVGWPNDEVLVFDIGLNRILPSLGIDDPLSYGLRPWIDSRRTAYGWKIYHLPSRSSSFVSPGSYQDGIWNLSRTIDNTIQIQFGRSGDLPFTGDWNGDGITDLGVYRESEERWLLDYSHDGSVDGEYQMIKPMAKAIPVVGDWDGNGVDSPGWYDPNAKIWHLFSAFDEATPNWPIIHFGEENAIPVVGDWDGDGSDTPGIVQASTNEFRFIDKLSNFPAVAGAFVLPPGTKWLPAHWFGDTMDTLAIIDEENKWTFLPGNRYCDPPNSYIKIEDVGQPGTVLAGNWGSK